MISDHNFEEIKSTGHQNKGYRNNFIMSNPPGAAENRNRFGMRRVRNDFNSSGQPARRSKRLSANTIAKLVKESASGTTPVFEPKRLSLFKHVLKRELYGFNDKPIKSVFSKHLSRNMPTIFQEHEIDLGQVNKVFAAQWVNDSQVVMGTKCNKVSHIIKFIHVLWCLHYFLAFLSQANIFVICMKSDRKSTRLNSSHMSESRMPSSA